MACVGEGLWGCDGQVALDFCGVSPIMSNIIWPRSSTAEQLTLNQLVVGSNPTEVTSK